MQTQNNELISKYHYWIINFLLLITAILLGFGLVMPLITFKQLIFFTNTFSVLSGVQALYSQKQYLLFSVILLFSILLPLLKLIMLVLNWNFPVTKDHYRRKLLSFSTVAARWSMLDVFAVAVFVVMMKLDLIAKVQTHRGLVIFTIAVLGLMILTAYINQTLSKILTSEDYPNIARRR